MAAIPPLLTRQRVLGCKLETTTGTAISIGDADAAFNVMDMLITPNFLTTKRPGQSSLSKLQGTPSAAAGEFTFKSELFGSGSGASPSPTYGDTLLPACGVVGSSHVFKPVSGSASFATLTMGGYQDGILKQIAGACGSFTLRGGSGKDPAVFDWRFIGPWVAPTDVALAAPTYPTVIPPTCAGMTFTIGGTAFRLSSWELAVNNELYLRPSMASATGYLSACIVNRDVQFKCSIEAPLLATKDFFADHAAGTTRAISLAIGSTAGNIATIAIPVAQLAEAPQDEDSGGTLHWGLTYDACRSAAAGDDEFSITYS